MQHNRTMDNNSWREFLLCFTVIYIYKSLYSIYVTVYWLGDVFDVENFTLWTWKANDKVV